MLSFDSALGPLTIVSSDMGITQVQFKASDAGDGTQLEQWAREEIESYLAGQRREFSVPLDRTALQVKRSFHDEVRHHLASISYGETRTYGEIAAELGRPGAARAVGTACARNPLPILVPCHRVLASKGLGGYLGGLPAKQYLLALEGIHWQP